MLSLCFLNFKLLLLAHLNALEADLGQVSVNRRFSSMVNRRFSMNPHLIAGRLRRSHRQQERRQGGEGATDRSARDAHDEAAAYEPPLTALGSSRPSQLPGP